MWSQLILDNPQTTYLWTYTAVSPPIPLVDTAKSWSDMNMVATLSYKNQWKEEGVHKWYYHPQKILYTLTQQEFKLRFQILDKESSGDLKHDIMAQEIT